MVLEDMSCFIKPDGRFYWLLLLLQETELLKESADNGSKYNYQRTKDGYLKIGKLLILI